VIPVLAERGGTQLRTPKPALLVDTREQNPFDFSRFEGWFAGIEKRPLKLGDYSLAGLEDRCARTPQGSPQNRPTVVTSKPDNGKWPGTRLFYSDASCGGKSVFVRQLRGPHLSTWP
jgi:hypothetical protein